MNDIHKKTAVWTSLYYGDIKVGGRGEGGEKAGRGEGGAGARQLWTAVYVPLKSQQTI